MVENSDERIKKLVNENANIKSLVDTVVKKLEEQAAKFEEDIDEAMWVLASAVEAMSIIRYYDLRAEVIDFSVHDGAFSCLKTLEEIRQTTANEERQEFILEREQNITSALLELTKHKNIAPNEVLDRLLKEYDTDVFREIVRFEDVFSTFGTAEALRWKQILSNQRKDWEIEE